MGTMIKCPLSTLGPIVAALAFTAVPALAQGKKLIDVYDKWSTFVENEKGELTCYAGSLPEKTEGKYTKRGDALTLVTHRPAEKSFDVISIQAGYIYRKESNVEVTIGGKRFELFTKGGNAWAKDSKSDRLMVAAMKSGDSMIVKGTSSRGTLTADTYSLSGFTAAYGAMRKACGRK
jgi:hypothetical protein